MKKDKLILGKFSPNAIALAAATLVIGLILGMFLKFTIEDKKYSCACFDEEENTVVTVEKALEMSIGKNIKYALNDNEVSISLNYNYDGERYITLDIISNNKVLINKQVIYDNKEVFTSEDTVLNVINKHYNKIKDNLDTLKDFSLDSNYLMLYYEDINYEYVLLFNDKGNLLNNDISNNMDYNTSIYLRNKKDNRTLSDNDDNTYKYILFNKYNMIEKHDNIYYYLDTSEICSKKVTEYSLVVDNGIVTKSITSIYEGTDNTILIKTDKDLKC